MKATRHFAAWCTLGCGCIRRIEIEASCQSSAIAAAYAALPSAQAVSVRPLDTPAPLRDALLVLDRVATGAPA